MITRKLVLALAALLVAGSVPAWAQSAPMKKGGMDMKMPMDEKPAHFAPTRQAYTTNRLFLVKLVSLPSEIPFEKYFDLKFAVYDGKHPAAPLQHATIEVYAGMRHGLKKGFAHGMQSSPKVSAEKGDFAVSGMFFHMMGPWTLKVTVVQGGKKGVAFFNLPCCAQ
jgi:hypothetical protein